jgi:hypothetical protein
MAAEWVHLLPKRESREVTTPTVRLLASGIAMSS